MGKISFIAIMMGFLGILVQVVGAILLSFGIMFSMVELDIRQTGVLLCILGGILILISVILIVVEYFLSKRE